MFFFFTCGTHVFNSPLKGAEHITVQCQNCNNFSGRVTKRWEWFTFCFVPLIPFSLKPRQEVRCHICNFGQDIKYQPDVQAQIAGNNGGGQGQGVMMHGGQDGAMGTHANGQGQVPMGVPPQYK